MRRKEFIDTILNGISDTFDIYHNSLARNPSGVQTFPEEIFNMSVILLAKKGMRITCLQPVPGSPGGCLRSD